MFDRTTTIVIGTIIVVALLSLTTTTVLKTCSPPDLDDIETRRITVRDHRGRVVITPSDLRMYAPDSDDPLLSLYLIPMKDTSCAAIAVVGRDGERIFYGCTNKDTP